MVKDPNELSPTVPFRTDVPDEEFRALVTVETMARLARHAASALPQASALLGAMVDEAQIRMATAVKDQGLSDRIAREASAIVRRYLADLDVTSASSTCTSTLPPCEGDRHRPDDDPTPGDRCKDCGHELTWLGPGQYDWELSCEHEDRGAAVVPQWSCPGCGTTYDESDADMIGEHVGTCDRVDGAGHPIGDNQP